jgi:hypothetical protein
MPKTGFNARWAMPVLKERDVMSTIAVPVVSEPVPAVVGTVRKKDEQTEQGSDKAERNAYLR